MGKRIAAYVNVIIIIPKSLIFSWQNIPGKFFCKSCFDTLAGCLTYKVLYFYLFNYQLKST